MSLASVNRNSIIKQQIHHGAREDTFYLTGRILKLVKPNPDWKDGDKEFDKELIEHVPMTIEGISGSNGVKLINKKPLKIALMDGWVSFIPTGYKYPKVNKERKIEMVGPTVIEHGAVFSNKDLSGYFKPLK